MRYVKRSRVALFGVSVCMDITVLSSSLSVLLLGSFYIRVEVVHFRFGIELVFLWMALRYHDPITYQLRMYTMAYS